MVERGMKPGDFVKTGPVKGFVFSTDPLVIISHGVIVTDQWDAAASSIRHSWRIIGGHVYVDDIGDVKVYPICRST